MNGNFPPVCQAHLFMHSITLCLFVWMVWCNNYSVFCRTGLLWVPLKCIHDYSFIDRLPCIHQTLSLLLPTNQDEVHFPASCLLRSDGSLHHEHEQRSSLYSPSIYKFNIKPTPPPAFFHMDQSKPKELLFKGIFFIFVYGCFMCLCTPCAQCPGSQKRA